jgi:hypothetical protein
LHHKSAHMRCCVQPKWLPEYLSSPSAHVPEIR